MTPTTTSTDPIQSVFVLLSTFRKLRNPAAWALRATLHRRGWRPGRQLRFWIHLCRTSRLLDDGSLPRPTLLVTEWLARPYSEQLADLLQAWVQMPSSPVIQRRRKRLLNLLQSQARARESISNLSPAYRRELPGLQALSICADSDPVRAAIPGGPPGQDGLTAAGRELLAGQPENTPAPPFIPWTITSDTDLKPTPTLHVPLPTDWPLLWELEDLLEPAGPGIYPITWAAITQTVQRGLGQKLISILERGLSSPPPCEVVERLSDQPPVRLLPGPVLEFADPADVTRLRQSPSLRRDLDASRLLSPRHVCLDPAQAPAVLRRLQRRGLLAFYPASHEISQRQRGTGNQGLSSSERTYLLAAVLAVQKLNLPLDPPHDLTAKLETGLPAPLRNAAMRQAQTAVQRFAPTASYSSTDHSDLPPNPSPQLLETLQRAIASSEALDVLYHVPGRSTAESRHLTPLLIEQRGPRHYLIAYCHARRANRTFRLDRLHLPDSTTSITDGARLALTDGR